MAFLIFPPFAVQCWNFVCTEWCACRLYYQRYCLSSQILFRGHRQSTASTLIYHFWFLAECLECWDWLLPSWLCGSASGATVLMIQQKIKALLLMPGLEGRYSSTEFRWHHDRQCSLRRRPFLLLQQEWCAKQCVPTQGRESKKEGRRESLPLEA